MICKVIIYIHLYGIAYMMIIYLDEKIKIESAEISHTYKGVLHLVDHYSGILSRVTNAQISNVDRQHLQEVIRKLKFHQQLYETYGKHLIDEQERAHTLQHPLGDTPELPANAGAEKDRSA